jgi:hypothetical protein
MVVLRNIKRIVEIMLDIPEAVAKTLGYSLEALPRRALEALLVDECYRGHLTRGKVAELLGLSFQENEELFRNCRVPYPIKTQADDALDNAALPKHS